MAAERARRGRSLATWLFVGVAVMLLPLLNIAAAQWNAQNELVRQFERVNREADLEVIPLVHLLGKVTAAPAAEALSRRTPLTALRWQQAADEVDRAFADLLAGDLDELDEYVRLDGIHEAWRDSRARVDVRLAAPERATRSADVIALETYETALIRVLNGLEDAVAAAEQERAASLARAEDVRRQARLALFAPLAIGLAVAAFAGGRLSRHILVPLRALEHAADRLAGGELSYRVDVRRRDELGSLASAFNEMAADLERGQAQLSHQALHDALTGLANRTLLTDRVEHALAGASRRGASVALLLFDLDGFKTVNDSLGHQSGDQVLVTAAERVTAGLPVGDTAARLGGDEFAVLLEDTDAERAYEVADQINTLLGVPFTVGGREVVLGASVGIALSAGVTGAEELLRNADLAMYRAKQLGKGRCELFQAEMYAAVVERLGLEAELRRAVEQDEFLVLYQPTVELATGRFVGCEALVRWQHPERGLIAPAEFIPLAEETGLIVPLGLRVLREACAQIARWRRQHPQLGSLVANVNLSARQLQHPDLPAQVDAALRAAGLDPAGLVLEITESVVMADVELSQRRLGQLKALGVRLALDDFGTGYSSFSYLQRFPFDVLKVDKSFVDPLGDGEQPAALAGAIVGVADALDLHTVAEGIERAEQAAALQALGCGYGQGYHFSRPVPADQLLAQLLAQVEPVTVAP